MAHGPDGSTYIGGGFTMVGPWTGSGVGVSASGDGEPALIPGVSGGDVFAVTPDGEGGWFIGGDFTHVAGVPRNRIAHIMPDGKVNPVWNPNANGTVYAIVVSGGEVFFGGWFTAVNGGATSRSRIAKTPAGGNGIVDANWNPDVNGTVYAIAVSEGEVFFGGTFTAVNGGATNWGRIAKTPAGGNGTVDPSWNPDVVSGFVGAIAVSPVDGDVWIGGRFSTVSGMPTHGIAKFTRGPYIQIFDEPAGENCADGGYRLELSDSWDIVYVCHGATGDSASVVVEEELPGENCAAGGQRIETRVGDGPVVVSYVCNGIDGTDGISAVAVAEPPGENCVHGGIRVTSAGDDQFICHSAPGTDGTDGESVTVTIEPSGENCPAGGYRLESISGVSYVCHGLSASVEVFEEPPGENCPAGGQRIETSIGDGPVVVSYVCNGTDGESVVVVAEAPGENCQYGGVKVSTAYTELFVCNGADGTDGADGRDGADGTDGVDGRDGEPGSDGRSAVVVAMTEPPGDNCVDGGLAIVSGIDLDGDGELAHSEIQSISFVCDPPSSGCSAAATGSRSPAAGLVLLAALLFVFRRGKARLAHRS